MASTTGYLPGPERSRAGRTLAGGSDRPRYTRRTLLLRVLFVCTGNICRSPIAHGLLVDRAARLGDGAIEVRSSGTWGRTGSPATPEAVAAAGQLGIDIERHRSSRFTDELARWADLVVTMTTEQAEEVRELSPDAASKTFTLKELVAILRTLPPADTRLTRETLLDRVSEADRVRSSDHVPPIDLDVADPLGLSETVYRAVASELEGLVDELVRGIVGQGDGALASGG